MSRSEPARVVAEPEALVLAASPARAFDWLLRVAIFLGLGGLAYYSFANEAFRLLFHTAESQRWSRLLERPSLLWAAMGTLLIVFRTLLWLRYRPAPPVTRLDAPMLTVIIPAYNEGAMVAQSIDSVAAADYPRDRLEIFVVDDGSADDTWLHIQAAAARHPGLVTPLKLPENRGKRHALAEGFRRARGEVLVTIDSDSVIDRGTLLAIAGPFRDPRVGAVAGKVSVLNRRQGVIPRMLAVRFILSFDLLRAVQSTYGTVYCCPGALSAWRAELVRELLPAWLGQRFLGAPCTYGEDRALTNFILARGFDAVYQRSAVVHTLVPRGYRKLCRMYLRWDRSYVREELRFFRVVWHRPPLARAIAFVDTVITNLRIPVGLASLVLLSSLVAHHPLVMVRLLVAIGLFAMLNMLYYLHSERSGDFLYGILYSYFSFFTLFWIFPYAVATARSRRWMTR